MHRPATRRKGFRHRQYSHLHAIEAHKVGQFVVLHNRLEEQEEDNQGYKLAAVVQRRQRSWAHSFSFQNQLMACGVNVICISPCLVESEQKISMPDKNDGLMIQQAADACRSPAQPSYKMHMNFQGSAQALTWEEVQPE